MIQIMKSENLTTQEELVKMRQNPSTLEKTIIHIVKNENPSTVEELTKIIQREHPLPQEEILEHILNLQNQGKLNLQEKPSPPPPTMIGHLLSPQAYWYWITITLTIATLIAVLVIPEKAFPAVYARYILGAIFVLWLPGYSLIKALFPKEVPIPTGTKELDNTERVALSIGMSLALVPITGLLLSYTPFGIRTIPITLSLMLLTMIFATVALLREYQTRSAR
jgi:hypothetical protein